VDKDGSGYRRDAPRTQAEEISAFQLAGTELPEVILLTQTERHVGTLWVAGK